MTGEPLEPLAYGLYEALLDERLKEIFRLHPDLHPVFGKVDPEEEPSRYVSFVSQVLNQALQESPPEKRIRLVNHLLEQIVLDGGLDDFRDKRLVPDEKSLLLEVTPPHYSGRTGLPRPQTPLAKSSLFTGSPSEPQLAHELLEEMYSADRVDILVSFIKWSGLRLLMEGFEDLLKNRVPVRVITTSYMGASDPPAVEWLSRLPNVEIRVSYDTQRTRLHAKAYLFHRLSGFSTAYIGSSNMSHPAMSSGLEWNLKVTAQDMGHILEKFRVEFETYWNSKEFVPFGRDQNETFRKAILQARKPDKHREAFFFDLRPHPFQERILEALDRDRLVHGRKRNLVVAATGTGKTVVAAFDFRRFHERKNRQARLLFVAHRVEILEQALATFRNVLRDHTFGEILGGGYEPSRLDHLFCSVGMLSSRRLWDQFKSDFYDFIVVDEVHHGPAGSYRPLFEHFSPEVLLGLTATPERMDGESVASDFGNRFSAEIRLPEALEEKLLCPFQYFGVADPVALSEDRFWKNGRFDVSALENVYTGDDVLAKNRLEVILSSLDRYLPDRSSLKGIGFCASQKHARYMAEQFNRRGILSNVILSDVNNAECRNRLDDLSSGKLTFLFTVDKLSEGIDLPSVNAVLFLRPTESLTVFLQQLGRGLRHAPEKDCLTVLDFVGQVHRRYRIDTKLKALLPRHRYSIEREVLEDFPHLPPGCSIRLDRIARKQVLENIRENLKNLSVVIPERLETFESETGRPLTFGNFVTYHDIEPDILLSSRSWSEWKSRARLALVPKDPDLTLLRESLIHASFMNDPEEIRVMKKTITCLQQKDIQQALSISGNWGAPIHRRLWRKKGSLLKMASLEDSFGRLCRNPSILFDLQEILDWALENSDASPSVPELPFRTSLRLHGRYGNEDLQGVLGHFSIETPGLRGVGVIPFKQIKTYALLVTFGKTEKDFSPTTMYADYPINQSLLHWESQSDTKALSEKGQNLIEHKKRGYTILVFARDVKKRNQHTVPFTYLGPVECESHEGERPIRMIWRLLYPMPADMFENNRRGG
jgi:superfamily II DNA or RNA helicase